MKEVFPAAKLPGAEFNLSVEVANTAANEIVSADLPSVFCPRDLGPYHKITVEFEKKAPKGGLYGPVTLSVWR